MTTRSFDLNIEEVLENWEVEHALREVISNALDEQLISQTKEIQIAKDDQGYWHIRDFGRGLKIDHFTLNENQEKIHAISGVIGKFGVGLKDALATFHRRGIEVIICSCYGTYRLKQEQKHGFTDIVTLHIDYDDTPISMEGTDFILKNVNDTDIKKAKALFLRFSDDTIIETTPYGQIISKTDSLSKVYIMGVLAAEEQNFLFSYNITSLTEAMKKKLNRERLHVGRTTYSDRVKAILKSTENPLVENQLIEQVRKRASGEQCDEMSWIEISQKALNLLHQDQSVAYLTEQEIQNRPEVLDHLQGDGYEVVVVSDQQKAKLVSQVSFGGPTVRTLEKYVQEFNESFQYTFVEIDQLTETEQNVFRYTPQILSLIGITDPRKSPVIRISETMRVTGDTTLGVWDSTLQAIVIKRSKLSSLSGYAATLLHEAAHATTGTVDATRAFEAVLTHYLGLTSTTAIGQSKSSDTSTDEGQADNKKGGLLSWFFGK